MSQNKLRCGEKTKSSNESITSTTGPFAKYGINNTKNSDTTIGFDYDNDYDQSGFRSALFITPVKLENEIGFTTGPADKFNKLPENSSDINSELTTDGWSNAKTPRSGDSLNFKNCISSDLLKRLEESSPIKSNINKSRGISGGINIGQSNDETQYESDQRVVDSRSLFYNSNNKTKNRSQNTLLFKDDSEDYDEVRDGEYNQEPNNSNSPVNFPKSIGNIQSTTVNNNFSDFVEFQNFQNFLQTFHKDSPASLYNKYSDFRRNIPINMSLSCNKKKNSSEKIIEPSNYTPKKNEINTLYYSECEGKNSKNSSNLNLKNEDNSNYSNSISNLSNKLSPLFEEQRHFYPKSFQLFNNNNNNLKYDNQISYSSDNLKNKFNGINTSLPSSQSLTIEEFSTRHGNISEYFNSKMNLNENSKNIKKTSTSTNNLSSNNTKEPNAYVNLAINTNINSNSNFSNRQHMYGRSGWICTICKNFNYEIRVKCNRCGKPQPQSQHLPEPQADSNLKFSSEEADIFFCNNVNKNVNNLKNISNVNNSNVHKSVNTTNYNKSQGHNHSRGSQLNNSDTDSVGKNENNTNSKSQTQDIYNQIELQNDSNDQEIKKNNKKPFVERVGDWVCIKCKNLNFSFRIICNRCELTKIESEKMFEQYMKNLMTYVKINDLLQNQIISTNYNKSTKNVKNENTKKINNNSSYYSSKKNKHSEMKTKTNISGKSTTEYLNNKKDYFTEENCGNYSK